MGDEADISIMGALMLVYKVNVKPALFKYEKWSFAYDDRLENTTHCLDS